MAKNKMNICCSMELAKSEGEELPRLFMVGNSGTKAMSVGFGAPLVVDFRGAKFSKETTKILLNHDATRIVGHTTEHAIVQAGETITMSGGREVSGPSIVADIVVSGVGTDAKECVAQMRNGFPYEASIGADILKYHEVKKGATAMVNGTEFIGPLYVVDACSIYEISVCPFGADDNTSVNVMNCSRKGTSNMEAKNLLEAAGFDEASVTEAQRAKLAELLETVHASGSEAVQTGVDAGDVVAEQRRIMAAETKRMNRIQGMAREFAGERIGKITLNNAEYSSVEDVIAAAIESGAEPNEVELSLRRAIRATPVGPNAGSNAGNLPTNINEVMACAALIDAGVPFNAKDVNTGQSYGLEQMFSPDVLEAAGDRRFRSPTLHQIYDTAIKAATNSGYDGNRASDDFLNTVRAARSELNLRSGRNRLFAAGTPSTYNLDVIFETIARGILESGYRVTPTTWRQIARVCNVKDFKETKIYSVELTGGLEQVGENGELAHGGFDSSNYGIAAQTYGKMFGFTRNMRINDELGAFTEFFRQMAYLAPRLQEELVYMALLQNRDTTFTASRGNKLGAGSVLSLEGIKMVSQSFAKTVDKSGRPVLNTPDRIVVGNALNDLAQDIYSFKTFINGVAQIDGTGLAPNNRYAGMFKVISSGFLDNTAIKQTTNKKAAAIPNQSEAQWFMLGDPNIPNNALIGLAVLNGRETPFVEREQADFNTLGDVVRVYTDCNAAILNPMAGRYATGAAST